MCQQEGSVEVFILGNPAGDCCDNNLNLISTAHLPQARLRIFPCTVSLNLHHYLQCEVGITIPLSQPRTAKHSKVK